MCVKRTNGLTVHQTGQRWGSTGGQKQIISACARSPRSCWLGGGSSPASCCFCIPWNLGVLILATRTGIFSPWQPCVHSASHSAFAQVSSAARTQPTPLDPWQPETDKRLHSETRLSQKKNIGRGRISVLAWNPLLWRNLNFLCSFKETQCSSTGTDFKVTSEFPHSYGTDGNGRGSRVPTAPLKML